MTQIPPSFARHAHLLVINPSGNKQRLPLDPIPFLIGRQADAHLVLRDNRASRQHARIGCENGEYFVEDLNSRHGVIVNGERIQQRRRLKSGDQIEFGVSDSYRVVFTQEEEQLHRLMEQMGATQTRGNAPANLAKLRALVEVARTVQSSLSTHSVLAAVVDAALTVTGAERGFLLLREGEELEVAVARDQSGAPLPASALGVPAASIRQALDERRDMLALQFDPKMPSLRNVVCVPLVEVRPGHTEETMVLSSRQNTLGVLYLETRPGVAGLSAGDRELLQTLAIEASTILENARLLERDRLRQKMDEELQIAREIQRSLMPRKLPQTGWFRAAAASLPSHQVGGDYYDVRQIDANRWACVVADVSGKGVSSALLASLLQGAFLAGGNAAARTEELMAQVNQFLVERTGGEKYATLFCGLLHRDGTLRWSNAGHCPPLLLRRSGEMLQLEATSMPLGMLEEASFSVEEVALAPGDILCIYTDGVSEARNAAGHYFETRRLRSLLRAHAGRRSEEVVQALLATLETFTEDTPQADDITAVVMEYAPET